VRFSAPVIHWFGAEITGALNTIAREAFSLSRYLLKWSILAPLCVMQRKETSMDRNAGRLSWMRFIARVVS
jgi:hypothetical protein